MIIKISTEDDSRSCDITECKNHGVVIVSGGAACHYCGNEVHLCRAHFGKMIQESLDIAGPMVLDALGIIPNDREPDKKIDPDLIIMINKMDSELALELGMTENPGSIIFVDKL
jgi:hypothetical protein